MRVRTEPWNPTYPGEPVQYRGWQTASDNRTFAEVKPSGSLRLKDCALLSRITTFVVSFLRGPSGPGNERDSSRYAGGTAKKLMFSYGVLLAEFTCFSFSEVLSKNYCSYVLRPVVSETLVHSCV